MRGGFNDQPCACNYVDEARMFALHTLAANLAIGAGLCAAFRQGTCWPYYLDANDLTDDYSWSNWGDTFRPGHAIYATHHIAPRGGGEE